ncbi:1-phosphofructokinase [Borrelia miyamotoi]|uniref:1-phosphofructokinase n=1 Tax=Borrelia miyamotoi TaxID=47466 RepID=A0AAP8YRN2_9SPIR|nr:1-phosphofructokinase [Borrelia miyamotoi]AHH04783.1 1-phosphofructokinase [Borrelia miyamotoi FR64b]ATQ14623.1 1-phosphofructokinase [Borrelia miyamotoi]ATQ15808.1 1-phosphofructokinase [Borrelia miyamotoi]ATQ16952.1 1-phosphofructokinase [Borrelia miyamotoi]ATQ18543.1 1-phosphofructokinase [Borrelia miyamotoi]
MIYTLTLNPSVDYKIFVDGFQKGCLNYVARDDFFAGGKGINVSSVLKNFQMESVIFGFLGGFTGDYIKNSLDLMGIEHDFVSIAGNTRINIKMMSDGKETEINGNSPAILQSDFQSLILKLKKLDKGMLVMSGSVPSSLGCGAYNEIAEHLSRDIQLIIDTSGLALRKVVDLNPFLIKPNIKELEEILDMNLNSTKELIDAGCKIVEMGVQNIIVSMGSDGAIFINNKDIFVASVPKINSVSTIGAGDSVVAGFIYAYQNGSSLCDSFRFGVASGTSTALKGQLCNLDDVNDTFDKVGIRRL